jgi:uncharacterized protein (TIGR03083 family)
MLPTPEKSAEAYGAVRARVTATLERLTADDLARAVPACPAWTVHDLVGHFVGEARDLANGNIEGAGTDPWTDGQVQWARTRSLDELLSSWSETGPTVEAVLPHAPASPAAQLVFDVCTHEQDLAGALGTVANRDHDQLPVALGFMANLLDGYTRGVGLAAVELVTPQERWLAGDGDAGIRIEGTRFDLLRGLGGRRTRAEVDALVTLGSFEPFAVLFGEGSPIHLPERSLGE